ncbi:autophagy-related protein 6 [Pseudohyphozyma bogoriensis]|nr:autophagy-related protein 6 [Pseudohyphozyma bogoriensis]
MQHHGSATCQKCRQPLRIAVGAPVGNGVGVDDSIAALTPSTYDLISSLALSHASHAPTSAPTVTDLSRIPPSLRAAYGTVTSPRSYASSHPPVRVTSPYGPASTPTPAHQFPLHSNGPADSFVVLTESVVGSARTATAAAESAASASNSPTTGAHQPTALTPHLTQLANLYRILSENSNVDHPLCTECMDVLIGLMGKELEEGKKEKDRLVAFEREVARKREETGPVGKDALTKEIGKYEKAERQATEELKALEEERAVLDKEKAELDAEEAALAAEEEQFWRDHSAYLIEAAALRDRNNSLQMRYTHEVAELEKLKKTNVYNDAFCIGHEAGFGTINKLRLGRLPGAPVEWPEINAAWGHTLLLLHTIARKFGFTFETYKLVPMGSFSRIEKITGDKAVYELYGSGEFNAVTRILQNRRFDLAMVAFLDCLRQMMEFVKSKDKSVKLPHAVVKEKIGDVSIKYQFSTDDLWTRALRHVLFDLKILLARASM